MAHEHEHYEHNHSHGIGGHHHHDARASEKNLWIAFGLNLGFAIIEIIGGLWTGSTAILSDALHDLGDSLALGSSALIQRFSQKQAGPKYNFGWKRLPVLGALLNIIILGVSSVYVVSEALPKLLNPQVIMSEGMILMAVFGIFANGLAVFRMRGSKRVLDRSVLLHMMEDLLGWIAVLIVAIVIYFTDWYWLDPLLSLIISGVMITNIFSNGKIILDIILGATLDEDFKRELMEEILELSPSIEAIDKFQLWSLDGDEHVATLQLRLDEAGDHEVIIQQVKDHLKREGISEVTIECCYPH